MAYELEQKWQQLRNRVRSGLVGKFFAWWLGELRQAMPASWQEKLQHAMRRVSFTLGEGLLSLAVDENRRLSDLDALPLSQEAALQEAAKLILEVKEHQADLARQQEATITNCEIRSLDDGIAIKTHFMLGFKRSCENISVKHSLFSVFVNGIKIGTESVGDFRHITYRNCIVRNSPNLPSYAGISIICVDGGTTDNVFASDITLLNINYPIFIRLGDGLRSPLNQSIGVIRNVTIQNLT